MISALPLVNEIDYFANVVTIISLLIAVPALFFAKASLIRQEDDSRRNSELDSITNLIDIFEREYNRNEKIISDYKAAGSDYSRLANINNNKIKPIIKNLNKELAKIINNNPYKFEEKLKSEIIDVLKLDEK
jgi:hypothetical protein